MTDITVRQWRSFYMDKFFKLFVLCCVAAVSVYVTATQIIIPIINNMNQIIPNMNHIISISTVMYIMWCYNILIVIGLIVYSAMIFNAYQTKKVECVDYQKDNDSSVEV